jgi:hypothetical protein
MRPERNAFWSTFTGCGPTRPEEQRLGSALNAKFSDTPLTQATARTEAGVFSFMPPPDPASPTCLIRSAGPGPVGAARHEIPATDGSL